MHTGLGC